jgi:hypothetical protein
MLPASNPVRESPPGNNKVSFDEDSGVGTTFINPPTTGGGDAVSLSFARQYTNL